MLFIGLIVLSVRLILPAIVVSEESQLENAVVLVGSELTIRCPLQSVNWFLHTNGTGGIPMELTNGSGCLENNSWMYKCSEGNRILNFSCTDKTYAGIYECRMQGKSASMHLTILESDPICNVTNVQVVENNYMYIDMRCFVNYGGNWAPVMEWGQYVTDNTLLEEFNDGNVTSNATNHGVISTFRFLADLRLYNSRYHCKTYFTNSSILYTKRSLAKNIPTYNHTWISPNIRELYCAKHLIGTRQLESLTSGILNCPTEENSTTEPPSGIAEGYSAVSYEEYTDQRATGPVYSVVVRRSTHEQSSSSHTEEAIWGNSMYKVMPNGNRQTALTEIKNNDPDGIIYAELGQVPRDRRNRDPDFVREQFEKSEYASIDHTSRVPLPAPQLGFNPSHFY